MQLGRRRVHLCSPRAEVALLQAPHRERPALEPARSDHAVKIDDKELFVIDSHTHMGRRNTPLGHGVASFLGEDLVRDMDELGIDKVIAFLGAVHGLLRV
jgi:hypothetical protein